jgi:catechol 2,3-dioxygenase
MPMHMNHVALRVSDVDRYVAFARETLGLAVTSHDSELALLTANDKHHELQLLAATEPGLDHIALELESVDELRAVCDRAVAAGGSLVDAADQTAVEAAARVAGPGDIVFELVAGMERSAPSVAPILTRFARKFGHVTLVTRHCEELVRFLVDGLGFRISDRVHPTVWLRCDADHHGIALVDAPPHVVNHVAFELSGWAAMQSYLDHLASLGYPILWGPGRHGPGHNLFTYLADPEGMLIEAYADLVRIDNDAAYVPMDWSDVPNWLNLWGPAMPQEFGTYSLPILTPTESRAPAATTTGAAAIVERTG